ncbi:restriction endonuclease [Shewanella fidelis]|uniref:Restriction endonuclease n=1 Tax=Shewanella fidelis TaxID=173509 RepID=A0AAW8NRC5_9GAMM|nr:restriction endonuclease [Shewanella fidelis]MDR8525457.1 restriction endonuclease [Shewanella fidelis]MDW4816896.1 restriction endonuclease [Shewanella fidelis]MDW4825689.1 restriction endonuclease [Shewanella fidelis]
MVNGIPSYEEMMPAVLKALADGQQKTLKQIYDDIAQHYGFTDEQLALTIPSGKTTYVRSRAGWAKTYMVKAGLIYQPKRGICEITAQGLEALSSEQLINNDYLSRFEAFNRFLSTSNTDSCLTNVSARDSTAQSPAIVPHKDDAQTPTEMIEKAFTALNSALADELIEQIHTLPPKFFEQLVVDLILAMGYGGSQKDAGQATQYSSDGGVDGIIKEDKLGLDSIYLQAKRYRDNTVGRPDIQAFAGALDMHRARKGVFITTSSFSKDARDFVTRIEKRIVLIDGRELAALMIEHNVGVSTRELYAVKAIDSDYFAEE